MSIVCFHKIRKLYKKGKHPLHTPLSGWQRALLFGRLLVPALALVGGDHFDPRITIQMIRAVAGAEKPEGIALARCPVDVLG